MNPEIKKLGQEEEPLTLKKSQGKFHHGRRITL